MPKKPSPIRVSHGRTVPNEMFTAAGGALHLANPILAAAAADLETHDARIGLSQAGRYTRVRDALMMRHGCSKATAERAIRDGKVMRVKRWQDAKPVAIKEARQPEPIRPPILSRTLGEIVAAVGGLLAQEACDESLADGVARCACGAEVIGAPQCWLCSNPMREQSIGGGT